MIHTHTHNITQSLKKEWNNAFAAIWIDLKNNIISEIGQTNTNVEWYHLYVESKKLHKWIYIQKKTH